MEVWTLIFVEGGLNVYEIGVYSSYELAVEAMNRHSQYNGFGPLDKIDKTPWCATCWGYGGHYEFMCHVVDNMPEE